MYQVTSRGPARIRCGSHRGRRVSLPSGSRGTYTSSGTDAATLVTIFVETKIAVSTCTCSRPSAAAYVALLTTVEELLQRRRARMPWPLGLGRTTLKARSRHACRFSTRTLVMPSSGGPVHPACRSVLLRRAITIGRKRRRHLLVLPDLWVGDSWERVRKTVQTSLLPMRCPRTRVASISLNVKIFRPATPLGLLPQTSPGYRPGPRRGSLHAAAHIGNFLGNFRALRAQANFETDLEKSLAGPNRFVYSLFQDKEAPCSGQPVS